MFIRLIKAAAGDGWAQGQSAVPQISAHLHKDGLVDNKRDKNLPSSFLRMSCLSNILSFRVSSHGTWCKEQEGEKIAECKQSALLLLVIKHFIEN